ncbi:MAG: sulfurtransferase TusA family protein [Gammaproteobacteria bacterium]|nr:sulfurtransferase TusA family protein [Gammaproteobacteria bacterium]
MSEIIEVDARRLFCPLPVIRLQNTINKNPPGTRVRIVSTDPGSMNDIPTWCRINGHQVLSSEEQDREFVFLVQKGDES